MADMDRGQIVPCLVGPPGIGKTQTVYQFAEDNGRRVVEMILSQRLPTEVSGLVMPDTETKSMEVFDHSRLASLRDGDILLFDELLEAPPMVLSACLTLIQERRLMSGKKLPDILIVAATNPTQTPSMNKLSLRQRFMWFEVEYNKSIWMKWIKDNLNIELDPSMKLLSLISTEGSGYNVLTPRTASKLLALGKKAFSDNSFDEFLYMVDSMFNDEVRNAFDQVFSTQSPKQQIITAIGHMVGEDVQDSFEDCSIKDMMDILNSLDNWKEISEKLSSVQMKRC